MNTAVNAIQNLLTAYQQKTALETCKEVTATMLDFQEEKEIEEDLKELYFKVIDGEFGNKGILKYCGIPIMRWDFGG